MLEPKSTKQGFYARRWVAISGQSESEQDEEVVDMDRLYSLRCCSSQPNTLDGITNREMGLCGRITLSFGRNFGSRRFFFALSCATLDEMT